MKNKYVIEYAIGEKEIKTTRKACSAVEAIDRLTDQYRWSWRSSLVDCETCGDEWCVGYIDTDGGINYEWYVSAKKKGKV